MLPTNKKQFVYILILLIPFFIFFSRQQIFNKLKLQTVDVLSGPLKVISIPLKEMRKLLYYHRTFDEYVRLRKRASELEARLVGQEEVLLENARLQKLLRFKQKLIYSSIPANVIGRNPSMWNSTMIVDKGSLNGIRQGMSVVNALGVVGKVSEVGKTTSKVLLLTDPQFSVAAKVQRPRESVLVTGSLKGLCRLKFLNDSADIRLGDKVITSKLSTTFPESIVIGEVVDIIKNEKNGALDCWVKPAVALSQLEEVLIISK